ncbi:hypothetical protein A3A46_02065 [Candidatus Roizmanbacteria bacterium RIFCSPLOWO2_01_FULL_37_13]|uniref:Uncharacterized protein n=1 Tax=Candidatus Roizmanbacteria bacterium RIFCSPHIGHO2_02_FULL_38_11 TaxID=1802039 RepID=A0A1F7GX73_9BACT|nr:MAG: hypothetical protein A3C25_00960 [Candidatus Roizmanbacteria bacterium RIFCSPHIGHO2_02_FULL_38_11]OGK35188.1 MAG: hypothetical protein A3F58_03865 [Candidatus Roizmanbacteria bacterium RIFCSPHIGHO2_12_FULL_37_9b]OGK42870.1 MAG: hypothetical protein A3A46_02065 [Candidatus Roizmanbacteria bacterium RIFCSPLOWO2_01_FULL_37_13]
MENNRFLRAFLISILFFATTHLVILYSYALYSRDFERANAFRILDLNLFFPDISKGGLSFFLSYFFVLLVFLIVYVFFTRPK